MNLDFSYFSEIEGLVGESFLIDLTLEGSLNSESMILDFGLCKSLVKSYVNEAVDHKFLLPIGSKYVEFERQPNAYITVHCDRGVDSLLVSAPEQAFAFIPSSFINKRILIDFLQKHLQTILPKNIKKVKLDFKSDDSSAFSLYSYSHGLAKHKGNCQRIVHGHRSIIDIKSGLSRQHELESYWVKRWNNKYLGSACDLQDFTVKPKFNGDYLNFNPINHFLFNYTSSQGVFTLYISKDICEILQTETTVESLAKHIAVYSKCLFHNAGNLEVVLYEGIDKGAVYCS